MATGGEVPGAMVRQSDAVYEYNCSPCKRNDVTIEATHYCPECDVCYCKACLCDHVVLGRSKVEQWGQAETTGGNAKSTKKEHTCSTCSQNDVTTEATHYCPECGACYCKSCLCDHAVLGRSKVEQWGQTDADCAQDQPRRDLKDTCRRHPGHHVTRYCVDDDAICCQLCLATDHRDCKRVEKISAVVMKDKVDITALKAAIASLERSTETLKGHIELKHALVENSHASYIRKLNAMEENVIAKFNQIRTNALFKKHNYIDKFSADKLMHKNITEELVRMKMDLDSIKDKQVLFVRTKRVKHLIRMATNMLDAADEGVFKCIPGVEEAQILESITVKVGVKMTDEIRRFPIERTGDKNDCEIVGLCTIANGNIVIAEKANKCLKLLDIYSVISRHQLQDTPLDICAVGDFEVAVVLDNRKILIVAVGTVFETVRILELDHQCTNVAYHNEKLYSTYTTNSCNSFCSSTCTICRIKIHTYDKSGKALGQMTAGIGGHLPSSYDSGTPICISEDGEKIYVAHRACLVVLNSEGRQITSSTNFSNIASLCVDSNGLIYALKGGSKEAIKLSQTDTGDLKMIGKVAFSMDETSTPGAAICYDKRLGRLLMSPQKGNYICIGNEPC